MQQPPESPQPPSSQPWYPPSPTQPPMQSGPLGEQWQTPVQQPLQPGMYPPPGNYPLSQPPQPPKKKHTGRNVLIAVIALVVALVACGGIIAAVTSASKPNAGTASSPTASPSSSQQATSQATSAPAQTGSQTFKVGQVVTVSNTWQITVLSAKTSPGGQFSTLQKPSDVYLLVTVTMKNISSQEQDASSLIQWGLKDGTGQTYDETIDADAPATPDGKVEAGSLLKGTIAYEVPKSMKSFTLSFQSDITSTGEVVWAITV